MDALEGEWNVTRVSGLLPPMVGVHKTISGGRGHTRVGPIPAAAFEVRGLELHYRGPFSCLVDVLEPDGDGFRGRSLLFGREFGRFRMSRVG